jgi:hypothetical protein
MSMRDPPASAGHVSPDEKCHECNLEAWKAKVKVFLLRGF